jgi:glutamine synthetase
MEEMGVKLLPSNLKEALANLKKDKTILDALGEGLSRSYLAVKSAEFEALGKLSSEREVDLLLEKY